MRAGSRRPAASGTVCIFQGRSEWIEKYFETVRDLRSRGFAVATLDWRGQGLSDRMLSDRRKGYVRDFSDYDIDLETFMREIVLPDCPPPIFALGHSTGATILIRAAHKGHRWFDRMVLTSPLIHLGGVDYTMGAGAAIVRVMRWAGFGSMYVPKSDTSIVESRPFLGNILTSDPVRYARNAAVLEADPALALGAPTVAWVDSAYRAMAQLQERSYPARIRQPIMIVAGGSDQVVSTDGDRGFRHPAARRLATGHCRRPARDPDGAGPLPFAILGGVRRVRSGYAAVLGGLAAKSFGGLQLPA